MKVRKMLFDQSIYALLAADTLQTYALQLESSSTH